MQQPLIEEGVPGGSSGFEPPTSPTTTTTTATNPPTTKSYDDLFPALPESSQPANTAAAAPQWGSNINNKMRVSSSVITQVFRVPYEERKIEGGSKFGEGESVQTCGSIMKETGAHIEISHGKDQSLTFLVTGKQNEVLQARVRILNHFQTQAHKSINIPKDHHKWILGKKRDRLKELERQTGTKIMVPNMNEESDVITITGPKEGIEKAEHEIRVTSDQQSKKAQERLNIPKIYHPFIVGPFSENLNQLIAETGARINVPPPSVMKDEIFIAGEKEGVAMAKSKIEAQYQELEKTCKTVSVEVPKCQHKYVFGPKGSTMAEILQQTGVSVEMPPTDSNTVTITLRGPHNKLGLALSYVYDKANSVKSSDVKVPSWLHKYIIGKQGQRIKEITANLPKVHVEFTEKEDKIKLEGPPEEVEKVQEQLEAIAQDLIRNTTFDEMQVDTKLFKHIIGKAGSAVNKLKDENNVTINIDESGLIRIEGAKSDVAKTKAELEQRISKLENEKERDVIIEQRHYGNIIGAKGESIRDIRDMFNQVQIVFPGSGERNDIVKVRGPKEDVDKCVKFLEKKVKELNENSFQLHVPIYKQFHKFIIGKGGSNIRKIREETNTKIDLPAEGDKSDSITITGKKENVEEARDKIRQIQEGLENIVIEEITIDPKFYNSLIGAKGKLIQSIMEDCGNVTIKFPSTDSKSDKVKVQGPKEDVERAKQQLLDLASERQLASYTAEVRAKAQHHKFLIGKNGANVKKIRDSTGARIIFPSNADEDKELIAIVGKKEAVEEAKRQLEAMVKDIDNIIEDQVCVEPKHHKHFVARRGEVLHRISDECGGVQISFPRSGVDSDRVVLKGSKECIDAAKARIEEIVADLKSMITIECVIAQKHHRTVMGSKGYRVQRVTADHDVQIKFPDKNDEYQSDLPNGETEEDESAPKPCDVIKITGKDVNCQKAKRALLDLVPITIEVQVPFDMHRSIIGKKGQAVRDLMDRYDVHFLINSAEVQDDTIKITGAPSNVEDAKQGLLERVKEIEAEEAEKALRQFTLHLTVNPEYHSKLIGRDGATIKKIRGDSDLQIKFPKKGDENESVITLIGYEDDVMRARDAILKIVEELDNKIKEEIEIDARVHSRLIGGRGRNIKKIMEDYKVGIRFPRTGDENANLVVLTGFEEDVAQAREHLLNLAEEYLQDVEETETREKLHTLNFNFEQQQQQPPAPQQQQQQQQQPHHHQQRRAYNPNGFVVQGGPWEQSAPNTASVTDFPAFGKKSAEPPQTAAPVSGAWGSRR